jgi:riboflavin-specific deaminase-like protein
MRVEAGSPASVGGQQAPLLRRLLPQGAGATAVDIVDGMGLREQLAGGGRRPYVVLNMASTADGRATIGGRSGAIGGRADRELFHALRGVADAVLAGAGTVRVEGYGRIVADERRRRQRRERGLSPEPLACVVSASLSLPSDLPLLGEAAARVVIVTASAASLPPVAAHVEYVRVGHAGELDLSAALGELRARFSVHTLLCEGGPHLSLQLLAAGLVDELFLTLAPKLAGGDGEAAGAPLRILAGAELPRPLALELIGVLESESELLLRYRLRAAGFAPGSAPAAADSVSREITSSSSLAS